MMLCLRLSFLLFGFLGALSAAAVGPRGPIGTNLQGISYWTPEVPFVDAMKSAGEWDSSDGQPLDLDANGNVKSLRPAQTARTLTMRKIGGHYPPGRYLVRYKGEGTLTLQFDARATLTNSRETFVEVRPSSSGDGIRVEISSTNPSNPLRDIEMIMPGGICEGDPFTHVSSRESCAPRRYFDFAEHKEILFYPVFLQRLRSYSALRFMDWMATNDSGVRRWSDRTPVSFATWASKNGAPLEVMIALANILRARPWFTLPHQADDDYAEHFASLLERTLDPTLKVYVEDSNEVWNPMFSQSAYARQRGAARSPAVDSLQYHAIRTRELAQIFRRALGDSRVIAVLGAQAANPWTAAHGLDYLKRQYGSSMGIDAVAIAPYFAVVPKPADAARFTSMSLDEFFAYVRTSALPRVRDMTARYKMLADIFNVHLIAYEGGQHMVGVHGAENDAKLNDLLDRFNRDPRIKTLYLDYLNSWKSAGGELFVHFNDVSTYSKWGRWGALEYVSQPRKAAPKFDAIETFIERQGPLESDSN